MLKTEDAAKVSRVPRLSSHFNDFMVYDLRCFPDP